MSTTQRATEVLPSDETSAPLKPTGTCEGHCVVPLEDATTDEPNSPRELSVASTDKSAVHVTKDSVKLLYQVPVHGPHEDPNTALLVRRARALSLSAFDRDVLEDISKKSKWTLTLLVTEDQSLMCGFVMLKIQNGSLQIADVAVVDNLRGHGLGRLLMEDAMKNARKRGDVYDVCLSALPEAERFYLRLGFKAHRDVTVDTGADDLVEGQVYMDKRLRARPRQRRK